jgi:hypothetical protein
MKTSMKDAIQHALNTADEAWIEQRFMTGDTAFDVMVMDFASVYRGTHGGEHYYAALLFTPVVTYTKTPFLRSNLTRRRQRQISPVFSKTASMCISSMT